MKKYTFESLAMMGEMYVDGEEAGVQSGTDFYLASDVDAREAQGTAVIKAQRERIAELQKALREIKNIHLCGFPDSGCEGDKVYEIVNSVLMVRESQ